MTEQEIKKVNVFMLQQKMNFKQKENAKIEIQDYTKMERLEVQ
ncbi:MAG: hypothetical protein ACXADW_06490 [Candidatus Hodarchaeales archaeon]